MTSRGRRGRTPTSRTKHRVHANGRPGQPTEYVFEDGELRPPKNQDNSLNKSSCANGVRRLPNYEAELPWKKSKCPVNM